MLQDQPTVVAAFLDENQKRLELKSHLMGVYNFQNIMSAIVIGRYFKVPSDKIKTAIEAYIPQNNRSQIIHKATNTYLLDAYNANPTSMQNALQYFAEIEASSKVAILGDMLELGDYSQQEHEKILTQALQLPIDTILLVGKAFGQVSTDHLPQVHHFEQTNEVRAWLSEQSLENCYFLIKGSRGIGLEGILKESTT